MEEFDEAFEITYDANEREKMKRAKKRVYWRDIIEHEEQKSRTQARLVQGADQKADPEALDQQIDDGKPLTEEEIAKMKGLGDDGQNFGSGKDDSPKQIGSVNPIEDFKKMISDRRHDRVNSAISQMRDVIDRYIRGSINGDIYDKAIECLLTLRNSCVSEDEAPLFNKFLEQLKDRYSRGHHKDFFAALVRQKVSLITYVESELSSIVTPEEAEQFLTLAPATTNSPDTQAPRTKQDADFDLLD